MSSWRSSSSKRLCSRVTAGSSRVDERGLADVGHAHHDHAHRLEHAVAVRHERRGEARHLRHIAGPLAGQRHRSHQLLVAEVPQPGCGRVRVGQVGLVQDLQAGALPVAAQLLDERIRARARKARVEQLHDHVDLAHGLRSLLARGGHVAGKPGDGHGATPS
jgi:hypothetical protein